MYTFMKTMSSSRSLETLNAYILKILCTGIDDKQMVLYIYRYSFSQVQLTTVSCIASGF